MRLRDFIDQLGDIANAVGEEAQVDVEVPGEVQGLRSILEFKVSISALPGDDSTVVIVVGEV